MLGLLAVVSVALFGDRAAVLSFVRPEAWAILDVVSRVLTPFIEWQQKVVPTVVVDLDEASANVAKEAPNAWNLVRALRLIVQAKPAAVVVDFDLSGKASDPKADEDLKAFLSEYVKADQGAQKVPLTFVKRLRVEDRKLVWEPSEFDDMVGKSDLVSWGHGRFLRDHDGVARRWTEALTVCRGEEKISVPSIAVRALTSPRWHGRYDGIQLVGSPPASCDVLANGQGRPHRLAQRGPRHCALERRPSAALVGGRSAGFD